MPSSITPLPFHQGGVKPDSIMGAFWCTVYPPHSSTTSAGMHPTLGISNRYMVRCGRLTQRTMPIHTWWQTFFGFHVKNSQMTIRAAPSISLFACWFQPAQTSQPTVFSSHNKPVPASSNQPRNQPTNRPIIGIPLLGKQDSIWILEACYLFYTWFKVINVITQIRPDSWALPVFKT